MIAEIEKPRKRTPPAWESQSEAVDVEPYIPLVDRYSSRYGPAGAVLRDEAYSAGMFGLVRAARLFDPARGLKFATFAKPHIIGSIRDRLREHSRSDGWNRVKGRVAVIGSIEHPTGEKDERLSDILADQRPDHEIDSHSLREALRAVLSERDAKLVEWSVLEDRKQRWIAEQLGVTESRVCQILREVLDRLRQRVRFDPDNGALYLPPVRQAPPILARRPSPSTVPADQDDLEESTPTPLTDHARPRYTGDLPRRQQEVLDLVRAWIEQHGRAPTYAEMGAHLGIGRDTVKVHVSALREKGLVERVAPRSHAPIRLVGQPIPEADPLTPAPEQIAPVEPPEPPELCWPVVGSLVRAAFDYRRALASGNPDEVALALSALASAACRRVA